MSAERPNLRPTVRYHTTVYAEEIQNLFDRSIENYGINNVVKVINGSLESVLHLIGFSLTQLKQINRELALNRSTQQKDEFEFSLTESEISENYQKLLKERPSRAHVIEHENRLYGVVVDEGMARICGQIKRIIPKRVTADNNSILNRGIKISTNSSEGQHLKYEDEVKKHIESGQHCVIVSEKGSAFVVPSDSTGHQYETPLTLVLGHGFVLINETTVQWIRTKQHLRDERRESTQLSTNESIVVSFAAICIGSNHIKVCGSGSVVNIKTIKEFYSCL